MTTNIIFAGVGGQGLILTTRIVVEAAIAAGENASGSDVYGLAQRGGSVWGMVRIGSKHFSPLVPKGKGDILVAMEQLEGMRWASHLKPNSTIIINNHRVFPTPVLLEQTEYPQDIPGSLRELGHKVIEVDGPGIAQELGNTRLANTVVLGALAQELDLDTKAWHKAISDNVPPKTIDLNIQAFGRSGK